MEYKHISNRYADKLIYIEFYVFYTPIFYIIVDFCVQYYSILVPRERTKKLIKLRCDFTLPRRRMTQTTDVRGCTKAHFSIPTTLLSTLPASGSGSDFYASACGGEEQRRAMIPQNLKSQSGVNGEARTKRVGPDATRKGRKTVIVRGRRARKRNRRNDTSSHPPARANQESESFVNEGARDVRMRFRRKLVCWAEAMMRISKIRHFVIKNLR